MLRFDDVVKCRDVAEFNLFAGRYLAERGLVADGKRGVAHRTYWALFYRWRDSIFARVSVG